jgi:hypothetical protein
MSKSNIYLPLIDVEFTICQLNLSLHIITIKIVCIINFFIKEKCITIYLNENNLKLDSST